MAEENKNIKGKINELAIYHTDAYAIAVKNGYKGTVEEWLASLVGKSAYEIAVAHGFDGTEEEWIKGITAEAENARDDAQASAANAEQSYKYSVSYANTAMLARTDAKNSEIKADTSAQNAKGYAKNSKDSEDKAYEYEEGARNYALAASQSAKDAAGYASSAYEAGHTAASNVVSELKISWAKEKQDAIDAIETAKQDMIEAVESEIAEERESMLEEIEKAAEIVQTKGDSETAVMSQKAVTEEFDAVNIALQNFGEITATKESVERILEVTSNKIALITKQVTNLEKGLPDDNFLTDDAVAYAKDVPANALPYAEIGKVGGMTRKCTNLIPFPYANTLDTKNGITFTVNTDGTITVNGTATDKATFYCTGSSLSLAKGSYVLSGLPENGSEGTFIICVATKAGTHMVECKSVSGTKFECDDDKSELSVRILVYKGATVNNLVFKPMLNRGTEVLPYEPYFEGLRSAPVTEVKSVGVNIFGGDALANKLVELAGATKDVITRTVTFSTASVHGKKLFANFKPNTKYTIIIYGRHSNSTARNSCLGVRYDDDDTTNRKSEWLEFSSMGTDSIAILTTSAKEAVSFIFGANNVGGSVTLQYDKCGVFEGVLSAEDFKPYTEHTLTFPSAVQELPGYGEGNPDNPTEYNSVICREDGSIIYSHKGGNVDGAWVALTTEENADISDILPADNFIGVEGNGTLTFVNENGYAVPSEVTYQLKEVTAWNS